jgi:hypothetical protein
MYNTLKFLASSRVVKTSVLLPIPGSPAINTMLPGTIPPPKNSVQFSIICCNNSSYLQLYVT